MVRRASILNLGQPDYPGQIAKLAARVVELESRFAPIESIQALVDARVDALEVRGINPPDLLTTLGISTLPAYAVTGFPVAANALDARLTALGF